MKTIKATIKRKWFLLILDGIKKEEYREVKPYWTKRIFGVDHLPDVPIGENLIQGETYLQLRNGYGPEAPELVVEVKGVRLDYPNPDLCPDNTDVTKLVYVLELGEVKAWNRCEKAKGILVLTPTLGWFLYWKKSLGVDSGRFWFTYSFPHYNRIAGLGPRVFNRYLRLPGYIQGIDQILDDLKNKKIESYGKD